MSDLELGSEENLAKSLDVMLRQTLESVILSGGSSESSTAGTTATSVATASTTSRSTSTSTESTVVASEETLGNFDQRSRSDKGRVGSVELDGRVANGGSEGSDQVNVQRQ